MIYISVCTEEIIHVPTIIDDMIQIEMSIEENDFVEIEILSTIVPGGDYEIYEGPYIVTPLTKKETTLGTNEKAMTDDVTVLKIPYIETSNPQGGLTVHIGDLDPNY